MRKLLWSLAIVLPLACAHGGFSDNTGWKPEPPPPDADAKAQQLIDQMWQAMGVLPAYQTYGELRFTFNFMDNGSLKKSDRFYWNRFEHRMRWEGNVSEGDMIAVRTDLNKADSCKAFHAKRNLGMQAQNKHNLVHDAAFEQLPSSECPHYKDGAEKGFVQARRWLLGPINLRDKGVTVKFMADQVAPDKKKYDGLQVKFGPDADWPNKDDEIVWLIGEDHLPVWMLWKQAGKEGWSAFSQEDWKDVGGGLKLPMSHKQFGTTIELQFANVQLAQRPEDDLYFEAVQQAGG